MQDLSKLLRFGLKAHTFQSVKPMENTIYSSLIGMSLVTLNVEQRRFHQLMQACQFVCLQSTWPDALNQVSCEIPESIGNKQI